VSDTDSFINEVTEEVRRDQLFRYFKRYGWIAGVAIALIVGGAAWTEWQKARDRASAQALGDTLIAALETEDEAARAEALAAVEASGAAAAIAGLLEANERQQAGDITGAAAALDAIATSSDTPSLYRDLASLKLLMLNVDGIAPDTRRAGFEALATPGAPFSLLAQEQIALMDVAAGDIEAALAGLAALAADATASSGMRDRANSLIVALGGEVETGPVSDVLAPATDQ
jgi:hypothetical protein